MELPCSGFATFEGFFCLAVSLSILGLRFRRSTTFAVAGRTIPDGEDHFSRQAEVLHCHAQQDVAASLHALRPEFLPLLFNQREDFAVGRMVGRS